MISEEDRLQEACDTIKAAMDSVKDYDQLCGLMSAQVQRMICDKAQNKPGEAKELADKFYMAYLKKIDWVTSMAYPNWAG